MGSRGLQAWWVVVGYRLGGEAWVTGLVGSRGLQAWWGGEGYRLGG